MDAHSLYFIGYALTATIAGIVVAKAQYIRKRREGTKINFMILKFIFGFALLMWTGAALGAVYYTFSTTAVAVSGVFGGIILSLFFGWQINMVIRKIQLDEKSIEELATHDALTGLWNRRVFHQTLMKEIKRVDQLGHPLTLMMLDIDNLCAINAEYGYEPGDMVLRELADMLLQLTRKMDFICRYRSKEIAVILPEMDVQYAEQFAMDVQEKIAAHTFDAGQGHRVKLTVTVGIVGYSEQTPTEPALVNAGESALFKAIESGPHSLYVVLPAA